MLLTNSGNSALFRGKKLKISKINILINILIKVMSAPVTGLCRTC